MLGFSYKHVIARSFHRTLEKSTRTKWVSPSELQFHWWYFISEERISTIVHPGTVEKRVSSLGLFSETVSHVELQMLLPLSSKCWDSRHAGRCLADVSSPQAWKGSLPLAFGWDTSRITKLNTFSRHPFPYKPKYGGRNVETEFDSVLEHGTCQARKFAKAFPTSHVEPVSPSSDLTRERRHWVSWFFVFPNTLVR